MSDIIRDKNQLSGIIVSEEKNNKISEEDYITPPIMEMKLSYEMRSDRGHGEVTMALIFKAQFATGVRRAKFYIYLVDFEGDPKRLHLLALSGPDCSRSSTIYWADDQITPGILAKTFPVTITKRSLQSALTAWRNTVDLLGRDNHAGLVELLEPKLPMMPFLQASVICLYQNDTPGDITWHKLESTSEAFEYWPPKPWVVIARSLRLADPEGAATNAPPSLDKPPIVDADTGSTGVSLTLNRPLIEGRDKLDSASLGNYILPYHHKGNRIDVDLGDWLYDPDSKEDKGRLLSSRVQLNGSTDNQAWAGVGANVKILLPLPPSPRPPTLQDRRSREFSVDEVEPDYGGME